MSNYPPGVTSHHPYFNPPPECEKCFGAGEITERRLLDDAFCHITCPNCSGTGVQPDSHDDGPDPDVKHDEDAYRRAFGELDNEPDRMEA